MTTPDLDPQQPVGLEGAGLPDAPDDAQLTLRDAGIDPDRLSIAYLG